MSLSRKDIQQGPLKVKAFAFDSVHMNAHCALAWRGSTAGAREEEAGRHLWLDGASFGLLLVIPRVRL